MRGVVGAAKAGRRSVAVGGEEGCRSLTEALAPLPDGTLVLVDGLVASTAPEVMVPAARRLRLVVLLHMPVGLGAVEELAVHGNARSCAPRRRSSRRASGPGSGC